jgi:hypothetical protein
MALGDSYTEGVGAEQDESWPRQLETLLNAAADRRFEVWNAGVAGSDPFFEFMLLKERLLAYQPDRVVIAVNSSDFNDYIFRGGMERFRPDGATVFRPAPRFEAFYHYSHLVRALAHCLAGFSQTLVSRTALPGWRAAAARDIAGCLAAAQACCAANGASLLVVLHPMTDECARSEPIATLQDLAARLRAARIPCIDVTADLRARVNSANLREYAWPLDEHFNARGYRLLAEALLTSAGRNYPDFFGSVRTASAPPRHPPNPIEGAHQ